MGFSCTRVINCEEGFFRAGQAQALHTCRRCMRPHTCHNLLPSVPPLSSMTRTVGPVRKQEERKQTEGVRQENAQDNVITLSVMTDGKERHVSQPHEPLARMVLSKSATRPSLGFRLPGDPVEARCTHDYGSRHHTPLLSSSTIHMPCSASNR